MNKKNWLVLVLVAALAITSFNSCKKDEEGDTEKGPTEWTRSTVFPEDPRNGASTFTINNVAYVVGGYLKTNEVLADNHAFNGSQWSTKANFIGPARHSAVGFAVNGKGYVGLGFGGEGVGELKDFYQYDPTANTWKKIADFPGEARFGAVAFSIGNYGYVGLGATSTDKTFSDIYKYDPAADKWTKDETTSFAFKKAYAYAFVINNVAYVGGGYSNNTATDDFYKFDGTKWEKLGSLKTDSYDARRYNASTFVIGNNGYVVAGRSASGLSGTVWKFSPSDNSWTEKHEPLPSAREKAVSFAIGDKGYIATGSSGTSYFDDNWEFVPVR
ncbi:Kelch repeat-containing protein [Sphingobacterium lactis]|uniref:Kelch repeat-containing protein n=1 Tax=Sphingobacterium lactis TaxID=797291 RepID=UPI003F7D475C